MKPEIRLPPPETPMALRDKTLCSFWNKVGKRKLKRYVKEVVTFIFLAAIILGMRYVLDQGYLSEAQIHRVVGEAGILGVPIFILLLSGGAVMFAPFWLLVGASTLMFGSTRGTVYSFLGIMLGACITFYLGRYVAVDFAQKQKMKWLQIDKWVERNGLMFMIGLRLTFFANPILNYAAGQTSLKFSDYVIGTAVGCFPGVLLIPHIVNFALHAETLVEMVTHPIFYSFACVRIGGSLLLLVMIKGYGDKKLFRGSRRAEPEVASE